MPHTKPVWNDDQVLANIIRLGAWQPSGPIAFSFLEQHPTYGMQRPNFAAFTPAQRDAARDAFAYIADVANLSFVEMADNKIEPGSGNRRITLSAVSVQQQFSGSALNYKDGATPAEIFGSELTLNNWFIAQKTPYAIGDWGRYVVLHEVLHALGLSHLGSYNGPGFNYHDHAEFVQDTRQYSVMSYWDASEAGSSHTLDGRLYLSATPLLYDIMGLHHLYGPNMTTRTGDTVYGFNSTAGRAAFDLAANPHAIFAIWDAGGNDTLDLSGYATSSRIDLNQGGFSDAGGLTGNISIAYGAVIENAIGGSGADRITGNEVANRLAGGAGFDILEGRGAGDLFVFAALPDSRTGGMRSDGKKFAPDWIVDFTPGEDRIDLSGIDAVAGTAANDAFAWIGANAFSGTAGELRYQLLGGGAHLFGDVDGDGIADFQIATGVTILVPVDIIF